MRDGGRAISKARFLGDLPLGWIPSEGEELVGLYTELRTELGPGHTLYDIDVEIIAHRTGTDDVLCWHIDDEQRLTVLHLSWLMKVEHNQ